MGKGWWIDTASVGTCAVIMETTDLQILLLHLWKDLNCAVCGKSKEDIDDWNGLDKQVEDHSGYLMPPPVYDLWSRKSSWFLKAEYGKDQSFCTPAIASGSLVTRDRGHDKPVWK